VKDYIIVEEYLANLYDYQELADYLELPCDKVRDVLRSVRGDIGKKVFEHAQNIMRVKTGKFLKEDPLAPKLSEIGEYIVKNDVSYREAAKIFGVSKKTICVYMTKRLCKCMPKLYKDVFETVKRHKEVSIENKERQKILKKEIYLLEQGYTINQIACYMNLSRNRVQRDLTYNSKRIDVDLNENIKARLHQNQVNSSEFSKR